MRAPTRVSCKSTASRYWPLLPPLFRVLPQRLVIKYKAILHGVPGRWIRTSPFRKGALFHASSMDNPRKTIVSLDATRFGIKSVVSVALPGELFLDGPGLRPHRRIFDRDFIFERAWPSAGPTLNEVQVLARALKIGLRTEVRYVEHERIAVPVATRVEYHWRMLAGKCGLPSMTMFRCHPWPWPTSSKI